MNHEINLKLSHHLQEYLAHIADEYVEVMNGAALEKYGRYLNDLTFEEVGTISTIVSTTWSQALNRAFAK